MRLGYFKQRGPAMKNRERGATLSEIIISLAVVGVMTAVGLPKLVKIIPNYRLTGTARSLVVHIHRAKLKAVQEGSIYYFDFDLDGDGNLESGGCFLWGDRNGNRRKELLEKSDMVMDFGTLANVRLQPYSRKLGGPKHGPNNTKIDAGGGDGVSFNQNRIKFNPNGTCSTGTIYLHNANGRTLAIRLRFNGLTQLWLHNGTKWERW
jgi:Tfp pilus assembly protein FimT